MKLSPVAPRPGDQVSVDKREKAIGQPVTFLEVIERERAVLKQHTKTQERLDEVQGVCAEAIQVVGHMLIQLGIFGTDDATYILDRLSAAANDASTEIPPERDEPWPIKPLLSRLAEVEAENAKLREEIRTTLLAEEERRKLTGDALQAEGERHEAEKKLAEVEAECLEQARLNGAGSERDARLLAKLAEVERKVAYYESALTIDDGELTALRGGGVAKAIKRTRVVDLIGKLAEVEAERDEQGRLKAMLCERKDKLEQEVVRLSRQLAESQAREARLWAALEKADEGLSHITRWAPVAADFEAGGKFDYAEGCGNADDAATLGAERCHFRLAEHARHALRAISPVLYGPAAPASDALGAIRRAQDALLHATNFSERLDALGALSRCFGEAPSS
jgi:hypothetical protein